MDQTAIFFPCVGLVALTMLVWLRMYFERIGELRHRRLAPQRIATSASPDYWQDVRASDNFRNLFEIPVLFYVLCVFLYIDLLVSPGYVLAAWLFVALRVAHSFIHLSYNRVMHRFAVYLLSSLLLFGMWAAFCIQLALER